MRFEGAPRRIVNYEYLQVPIRESLIKTLNLYSPKGWRLVDQYSIKSDNNGAFADTFVYPDNVTVKFYGDYKVILLEREEHEFRSLT